MNSNISILKAYTLKIGVIVLFLFSSSGLIAQAPTHYPTGNDPVELTPFNIFIYIVVPVLFVIIYLWWRRIKIKERKKKLEEKKSD
ncbi:MAG: hypothetical protein ACP5E3_13555 [Bacteroidales bacterium]